MGDEKGGSVVGDVLVGASLGAFIGFLVGMTTSPVVAVVVGVVSAGAMAALGLAEGSAAAVGHGRRIIGFGLAGVLAAGTGVYVRTHEVLAMTPAAYMSKSRWEGIDLDKDQKVAIAMSRFAGLVPDGVTETQAGPSEQGSGGFFMDDAAEIAFVDPLKGSIEVVLQKWENREAWRDFANEVGAMDATEAEKRSALLAYWRVMERRLKESE